MNSQGKQFPFYSGASVWLAPGKRWKQCTHLVIAAHQDDVEIMAAYGILECYKKQNKHLVAVVLTNGKSSPRAGHYAHWGPEKMAQERMKEQIRAAKLGGYLGVLQLGYDSSLLKSKKERKQVVDHLVKVIASTSPAHVYLHNPFDKHLSHVAACYVGLEALKKKSGKYKSVIGCEVWRGLDWLPDSQKIPMNVSERLHLQKKLIQVYKTQVQGGKKYDEGSLGRRLANATFFESHRVDEATALSFGVDLLPFVKNPKLSYSAFVKKHVQGFENELSSSLKTLSLR